ncbi:DUF4181 domain-containing protein [Psychrobacillus sp. FSL H8-0484]|uniref:DUF4181 domain-containing protein n=1 Tax=Psychrobacillus sp. FSL H8-0484 TaxID=2921390 RepID=UPI0030FA33E9
MMFLLKAIVFILIVIAIITVFEIGLRKFFHIGKRDKTKQRYVNEFHKRGEIGLIVVFVLSYIFVLNNYSEAQWSYLWSAFFFTALQLFRAYMEWKYPIRPREYIIHLFAAVVIVAFILISLYTDWLNWLFGF